MYIDEILEHHRLVSGRMATHLLLTSENIARSTWLAAGMLRKDAEKAQECANEYLTHLRLGRDLSAFDKAIADGPLLPLQSENFVAYAHIVIRL